MVLLLVAPAVAAAAAEPEQPTAAMTLEQALERGFEINARVAARQHGVAAAREQIHGAWGEFLPTLTLTHEQRRLSDAEFSGVPDNDYLDQRSESSSVQLRQPLFAGLGNLAGLRRSRLGHKASRHELKYARLQLAHEIRNDFHATLHAQAAIIKWKESIERLQDQQRLARAWYERQLATKLRLLEVEVELSRARRQLAGARSRLEVARARMAHWLALDDPATFNPVGKLDEQLAEQFPPAGDALEIARRQRPDLKVARLMVEQAEQERRQIAARNLPQLDLEGSWTDYHRDYRSSSRPDDDRRYYSVSLRLTMRPFQGGRNIAAWRQQGHEIRRLMAERRESQQQLTAELRNAYSRWQESSFAVRTAADSRRQAQAAWDHAQRSLELGSGSLRDTLDAEIRLTRAELELLEARLQRRQSEAEMLYALGTQNQ